MAHNPYKFEVGDEVAYGDFRAANWQKAKFGCVAKVTRTGQVTLTNGMKFDKNNQNDDRRKVVNGWRTGTVYTVIPIQIYREWRQEVTGDTDRLRAACKIQRILKKFRGGFGATKIDSATQEELINLIKTL
jgi:hypothetical protein